MKTIILLLTIFTSSLILGKNTGFISQPHGSFEKYSQFELNYQQIQNIFESQSGLRYVDAQLNTPKTIINALQLNNVFNKGGANLVFLFPNPRQTSNKHFLESDPLLYEVLYNSPIKFEIENGSNDLLEKFSQMFNTKTKSSIHNTIHSEFPFLKQTYVNVYSNYKEKFALMNNQTLVMFNISDDNKGYRIIDFEQAKVLTKGKTLEENFNKFYKGHFILSLKSLQLVIVVQDKNEAIHFQDKSQLIDLIADLLSMYEISARVKKGSNAPHFVIFQITSFAQIELLHLESDEIKRVVNKIFSIAFLKMKQNLMKVFKSYEIESSFFFYDEPLNDLVYLEDQLTNKINIQKLIEESGNKENKKVPDSAVYKSALQFQHNLQDVKILAQTKDFFSEDADMESFYIKIVGLTMAIILGCVLIFVFDDDYAKDSVVMARFIFQRDHNQIFADEY